MPHNRRLVTQHPTMTLPKEGQTSSRKQRRDTYLHLQAKGKKALFNLLFTPYASNLILLTLLYLNIILSLSKLILFFHILPVSIPDVKNYFSTSNLFLPKPSQPYSGKLKRKPITAKPHTQIKQSSHNINNQTKTKETRINPTTNQTNTIQQKQNPHRPTTVTTTTTHH